MGLNLICCIPFLYFLYFGGFLWEKNSCFFPARYGRIGEVTHGQQLQDWGSKGLNNKYKNIGSEGLNNIHKITKRNYRLLEKFYRYKNFIVYGRSVVCFSPNRLTIVPSLPFPCSARGSNSLAQGPLSIHYLQHFP